MCGKVGFPNGLDKPAFEEAVKANEQIQALIGDKTVRKLIAVPGKIINIVLANTANEAFNKIRRRGVLFYLGNAV